MICSRGKKNCCLTVLNKQIKILRVTTKRRQRIYIIQHADEKKKKPQRKAKKRRYREKHIMTEINVKMLVIAMKVNDLSVPKFFNWIFKYRAKIIF